MSSMISDLQAAFKTTREGFTVSELLALAKLPASQVNRVKVRAWLLGEITAGRARGTIGRRIAIDGYPRSIPIYLPVNATARKKK